MELINPKEPDHNQEFFKQMNRKSQEGRILGGLVIVAFGILFLLRALGLELPHFLFSWPMFMIGIGLYVGARHQFQKPGWLIVVGIGTVFLLMNAFPDLQMKKFFWPVFIIFVGLMVMFKPRRWQNHSFKDWKQGHRHNWNEHNNTEKVAGQSNPVEASDVLEVVAIFGGAKRNVFTKNFKGGEVTAIFGGADISLMQADIDGTAIVEMTTLFGGTKLLVPAHWEVQSDIVTVLGGVEDKRPLHVPDPAAVKKVLILKGVCVFGGVDIKSY